MAAKGNNSAKIENMLNLALDTTEQEREKSISLNVGYDGKTRTWEVVVKFFGTAEQLRERLREELGQETEQIGIYNLSNEYAILNIPEVLVEQVAGVPEIEYMEKPNVFFLQWKTE